MCGWTDLIIMSIYLYGLFAVLLNGYRYARRLFPPLRAYLPPVHTRPLFRAEKLRERID